MERAHWTAVRRRAFERARSARSTSAIHPSTNRGVNDMSVLENVSSPAQLGVWTSVQARGPHHNLVVQASRLPQAA